MMAGRSRRGSALLIVLGMLAFMVVSAVAFSAYMRSARLPSSYLRRTAAARQLVKAALTEAIERIDVAIGENAYPDQRVGSKLPSSDRMSMLEESSGRRRNYWYNNVFIGDDSFLTPDDTVSVLTLEGLAYLPPPLVNEARRYSRLSHAATWHTLGFDAGRYAYCAVDVTGCLDINRLVANGRRNSGRRRVTMAHVFENTEHSAYDGDLAKWESFMSRFRENVKDEEDVTKPRFVDGKVPLVSMADWNLANGAEGLSGLVSPFCNYINGTGMDFYELGSANSPAANRLRAMNFMTDSYLPGRSEEELDEDGEVDLAGEDGQPFYSFSDSASLRDVIAMGGQNSSDGLAALGKKMSRLDFVNLYDYLDDNNVPVSLAVPTTERVPMICSVKPVLKSKMALTGATDGNPAFDSNANVYKLRFEYRLDSSLLSGAIRALAAFPFKRGKERNETFSYDACVRVFFAPKDMNLRLPMSAIRPTGPEDFAGSSAKLDNGVIKMSQRISAPSFQNIKGESDAVKPLEFILPSVAGALSDPVMWVEGTCQKAGGQAGGPDLTTFQATEAHCNMPPLKADGTPDPDYAEDARFLNIVGEKGDEFALHVAVYIRVTNSDGKTVDLVPACALDDKDLNGINTPSLAAIATTICGQNVPLLRFTSTKTVRFTKDGFDNLPGDMEFADTGLMCPDPRFNYAPENWIRVAATDAQTWLDNCGAKDRDGDIFMFVSDQEYLQSIYELAFLPNLSGLERSGDLTMGTYQKPPTSATDYPSDIDGCVHGDLMWNTYRCYKSGENARHRFENIGLVLNDGAYRVNPCLQSVDALMAAFANTPYDWWAASTNNIDITSSDLNSAKDFNRKYAFSAMNNEAKFSWTDLRSVAESFRNKVRAHGGDWEAAFDALDWDGASSDFCDVTLNDTVELSTVDRKFLYGFWRDSFANRQQLFLVFVRAEPTMMGGGSVSQIPPQLGARAVALVWRDPGMEYPSDDEKKPHRTRVLFYRQFE